MPILFLVIILAAILCLKLLPVFSSGTQLFTDFIIENVSLSGLSKSGELNLFWLFAICGTILFIFLLFLFSKFFPKLNEKINASNKADSQNLLMFCIIMCPFLFYLIVFKQFSIPLFFALIICAASLFIDKLNFKTTILIYVLTYYSLLSILSTGCLFSTLFQISQGRIYFHTLLFGTAFLGISLYIENRNKKWHFSQQLILLLQCFLPGLLAVNIIDKYQYQGTIIKVPYALGYYLFFAVIAVVTLFLLIYSFLESIKKEKKDYIHFLTPMLIFAYHSFCAAPMYAQPDQHHHGEQMIPWNQIFEHGQTLYNSYTPVSGLFPYVNGFIQHVLLNGTISDYAPAISITMVIFCFLTMYLIYKHVGGTKALLFAVLFTLPCYNRQYLVLPLLLLFTLPGIINRPLLWFAFYIFGSYIGGLYYPLYGAAVLFGAAPIAIWQIVKIIQSKTNDKETNSAPAKKSGTITLIVCYCAIAIIIIASFPLLSRILKHTLTYSSQTITADGITISNQLAPDYFMPYLAQYASIRQYLYLAFRFLLPLIGLWVFAYYIYQAFCKKQYSYCLYFLAGFITLCISYTYSLVRADTGKILSRTAPILIVVLGMYLPITLLRFGKEQVLSYSSQVMVGFCVSLPLLLYMQVSQTKNPDIWVYPDGESQLVMHDSDKLFSYYQVPETFLKSDDTGLPPRYQALLGKGFMVNDQISYIEQYANVVEKCEAVSDSVSYMAFDGQGFFDYLGVRCYGTGYIPAARSYAAQKEIWDSDPDHLPVIFYIQPEFDYYIFRFMVDAGYCYSASDQAFYPPELFEQLKSHGLISTADDYRYDVSPLDFSLSASSFGSSKDGLIKAFTLSEKETSLDTLPTIDGALYDVLSIDFDNESIEKLYDGDISNLVIDINWRNTDAIDFDGNHVTCQYGNGHILAPMGMNACWSLSEINHIDISLINPDNGESIGYTQYDAGTVTGDCDSMSVKLQSILLNR